jgi:hypothetical protein
VADAASIHLAAEGDGESSQTVLRRSDGEWRLVIGDGLYPADETRVSGLLDALSQLQKLRIAASSSEYHEDFEVAGDAQRILELRGADDEVLTRLIVGKTVPGGGRSYLREGDAPEVTIVDENIGTYFGKQTSYWSDLSPLPDDVTGDSVASISVDADITVTQEMRVIDRYTLYRESGDEGPVWRMDTDGEAQPLDQQAVDDVAAAVAGLEAAAFVTTAVEDSGLSSPAAVVTFEDDSAGRYEILLGNSAGENRFFMRVSGPDVDTAADGDPFLYEVSSWQVRSMLKNRDALVADENGG